MTNVTASQPLQMQTVVNKAHERIFFIKDNFGQLFRASYFAQL